MMLNLNQVSTLVAIVSVATVLIITLVRQKRLDKKDLGAIGAAFLAGSNIPVAIFVCCYVFDPDSPELLAKTKLSGIEKYLCFSGIALLFLSFSTIWMVVQASYKIEKDH